ncbi:MCE family protein [Streptomyces sp. NBC_01167]|uniref:MCE family protein n=1 Tax=Streptomyces sp. NBC_01167 TaxID=2903756 RepID=UPI00386EF53E|nr:MCE family protein [Streptomyces sp. NBC_01167]
MSAPRRHRAVALATAMGSVLLTGCDFNGLYDVDLPGGAAADGNAYHVTADFRDVLDLVPQSAVKVNNVTVGAVEKVELVDWHARVRLRIADDVKLPGNAVAELRQTSMLGEKYVALSPPVGIGASGRLTDGARIPLSRTGRNPEIEEVLSALSALLNGGGVAQLKTITVELNKALEGRENRVKDLLRELDTFIGGLDKQRKEIVRALKGIDRLAKRLAAEKKTIAQAVDTVPGALKVLADQRSDLTAMLTSLSELGKTGTKVINTSRADTVANLKSLQPILQQLNKAGSDLPNSLELLTTYPFPRNVTGAIKGDYVNLKITADLDLASVYGNLAEEPPGPGPEKPELPEVPRTPDLPDLPKVPLPTAPPEIPGAPTPGAPPPPGSDGLLCPPVCTGSQISHRDGDGRRLPAGIDLALAELMLKGMQP